MGVNQSNSQVSLDLCNADVATITTYHNFLHTADQRDETEKLIQGLYLAGRDTS